MKRIGYACSLLLSLQVARAQVLTSADLRLLSARWSVYYATVYRVPIELVEAVIDEESAWSPYAVSRKGAVGLMNLCRRRQRGLAFAIAIALTRTSGAAWLIWRG